MTETRVLTVNPSDTETTININSCFGWMVSSIQPICDVNGKHLSDQLVLIRDTDMPDYDRLNKLYCEYLDFSQQAERLIDSAYKKASKATVIAGVIAGSITAVVTFILMYDPSSLDFNSSVILVGLIGILAALILCVIVLPLFYFLIRSIFLSSTKKQREELYLNLSEITRNSVDYSSFKKTLQNRSSRNKTDFKTDEQDNID